MLNKSTFFVMYMKENFQLTLIAIINVFLCAKRTSQFARRTEAVREIFELF